MRRHLAFTQRLDELDHVLGLVGTERDPLPGKPMIVDEGEGCLALGCAGRLRYVAGNCQAVAVLHQDMAHIAQPALLAVALAVELGIRVCRAFVGLIRPFLTVEVTLAVAAARGRITTPVPLAESSSSRPKPSTAFRPPRSDRSTEA